MRACAPWLVRAPQRTAPPPRLRLLSPHPLRSHPTCGLSGTARALGANRVYQAVRSAADLDTLLLQTAAARVPLLTLWTASWCTACERAAPYVLSAVEDARFGEAAGGVAFAEVEFDAPGNQELGERYMITTIPTLMAFSRQEAQIGTRITNPKDIMNPEFLRRWIETEASRGGDGGAGGKGPLGKLFDTFGKG